MEGISITPQENSLRELMPRDWAEAYACFLLKDQNTFYTQQILASLLLAPEERSISDFQAECERLFSIPLNSSFKARISRALTCIGRACPGLVTLQRGSIGLNQTKLLEIKLPENLEKAARELALRYALDRERRRRREAIYAVLNGHGLSLIEGLDLIYYLENPVKPGSNDNRLFFSTSLRSACDKLPQEWFVNGEESITFAPGALAPIPPLIDENNAGQYFHLPDGNYPLAVLRPSKAPELAPKPANKPKTEQSTARKWVINSIRECASSGYFVTFPRLETSVDVSREARVERAIKAHDVEQRVLMYEARLRREAEAKTVEREGKCTFLLQPDTED